jgi:2-(1,2-epoxy-1,2-dihydrophenyl)acetyl-CoA isomerase
MTNPVLLDVTDHVARITLNRPERGNAINQPMADALLNAALLCANDPEVRCVVLTGAGKMFCVGGDVDDFADNNAGIGGFSGAASGHIASGDDVFCVDEETHDLPGERPCRRGGAEHGDQW